MPKIFITGSTGMVGGYVKQSPYLENYTAFMPNRADFDCNDPDQIYQKICDNPCDITLHLAAETNVDLCQTHPELAFLRNTKATIAIAEAVKKNKGFLIFISTAYIFGKEIKDFYREDDNAGALNHYGQSKLYAEQAIREILPKHHIIIRPSWMVGGGMVRDIKFVGKIMQILQSGKTELQIVKDQFGSLSFAKNVVDDIFRLLNAGFIGDFHSASIGKINRCDLARAMAQKFAPNIKINEISASQFARTTPLADSYALQSIHQDKFPNRPWHRDFDEYLSTEWR